ncbi:MAG: hemagglutinin repeat-containing protein, partial [Polaromonas sp.]|nr:hemagglutinin repeat-containing protein [Polaromonas sp.]
IRLLAAKNDYTQTSSNSSSSGSIGFSIGANTGVTLSASKARGNSDGTDTSYTNTLIQAGNTASLTSGGDTTLKGAVVAGNQVKADVGGNLNIQSLQDTSTFTGQQSSSGASITIGPAFIPTGGGFSASKSNINSNYASVAQQSGIKAGDGGFQVKAAGNTDLKGGVIASTEAAVALARNTFTTGSLSFSDIRNSADYKGSGVSVSASMGSGQDAKGDPIYKPGGGVGVGSTAGNASSTTSAGISGIAGNTSVRTGDAETGIQKIFDSEKVRKEIDAQMAITAAFGQQASSAWGTFANQKMVDAKDEEERACWSANGNCRIAGHTVIGALGGGIEGALGAAGSTALAPYLSKAIDDLGITGPARDALVAGLSSTIGGVLGGTAGAAGAFNEVTNNYLTSKQWEALAQALKACNKNDACEKDERTKYSQISKEQEASFAVCDITGNCDKLKAEVIEGRATQIRLVKSGSLPDYAMGGFDLQLFSLKMLNRPAYREQVGKSVEAQFICQLDKPACDIQTAKMAIGLGIALAGGAAASYLVSSLPAIAAAAKMSATACAA